jgi:hypothetical protein
MFAAGEAKIKRTVVMGGAQVRSVLRQRSLHIGYENGAEIIRAFNA